MKHKCCKNCTFAEKMPGYEMGYKQGYSDGEESVKGRVTQGLFDKLNRELDEIWSGNTLFVDPFDGEHLRYGKKPII